MKIFIVYTRSESGYARHYVVKHPQTPTLEELRLFLSVNATDKDSTNCNEDVEDICEVGEEVNTSIIPTEGKLLEFA